MIKINSRITKILSLALVVIAGLGVTLMPQADTSAKDIPIAASDYGYGEYVVTARGVGYGGVTDEDYVVFYYYPAYAEVTENEEADGYDVDLFYNAYDGTEDGGEVASLVVRVYDSEGNLIEGLSPVTVIPPTNKVTLSFGDHGLKTGTYTISVSSYDKDGKLLYKAYTVNVDYDDGTVPVPSTGTPDTGGLFQGLNISRTDYLVTGIGIFLVVGIAGAVFVAKSKKSARSSRRRR